MFEKIETLVAQNVEPVKAVIAISAQTAGVIFGLIVLISVVAYTAWFSFCYDRENKYTVKHSLKHYSLYVTSIIGSYVVFIYVLCLIAIYTPVRYLIGYAALRYLNLI